MTEVAAAKPKKRFTGRTKPSDGVSKASPVPLNQIPASILNDQILNRAISALLPANYSFEIHKTVWQIQKYGIKRVALQMPEGLSMWSCAIVDIIEQFTSAEALVLGDVTYGACCVDDLTAKALGCDMLVHYGHSCLIPVDNTTIRTLYVFVEITIDRSHLAQSVRYNFPECLKDDEESTVPKDSSKPLIDIVSATEPEPMSVEPFRLACVGTVQFLAAVQNLGTDIDHLKQGNTRLAITAAESSADEEGETAQRQVIEVVVPQIKPLSPGEILGCTAPRLPSNTDAILYVGDGRFHLESIMIANPGIPAFRYDPYEKRLTSEGYEHQVMRQMRAEAVAAGKKTLKVDDAADNDDDATWGVVLGTLGRQGSVSVLKSITDKLPSSRAVPILMSELSPHKLSLMAPHVSLFVQTSCPRLSIDWGYAFPRPLLSPYEASIALGRAIDWQEMGDYAMDFWADETAGNWTPRHHIGVRERERKAEREARRAARANAE